MHWHLSQQRGIQSLCYPSHGKYNEHLPVALSSQPELFLSWGHGLVCVSVLLRHRDDCCAADGGPSTKQHRQPFHRAAAIQRSGHMMTRRGRRNEMKVFNVAKRRWRVHLFTAVITLQSLSWKKTYGIIKCNTFGFFNTLKCMTYCQDVWRWSPFSFHNSFNFFDAFSDAMATATSIF